MHDHISSLIPQLQGMIVLTLPAGHLPQDSQHNASAICPRMIGHLGIKFGYAMVVS